MAEDGPDGVEAIVDVLDPPDHVDVVDVTGVTHRCAAVLSARAAIRIGRNVRRLSEIAVDVDAEVLRKMQTGAASFSDVLAYFLRLVEDERASTALCESFFVAHPNVAIAALVNLGVAQAGQYDARTNPPPVDALLDAFPLEELVKGLVPFFVRLATTGTAAMARVKTTAIPQKASNG